MDVEILTTCVKQFSSDWNVNYHKPGMELVNGIKVRRFKVRKRDTAAFDAVNAKLLRKNSITASEEKIFINEMVNSPDMYQYMKEHQKAYGLFVFIPYMFGTTYYGIQQCPEKSVVIPCFHDEAYIYLEIYNKAFEQAAGMIYLARPEYDLANKVFDLKNTVQAVLGAGVDTQFASNPERFKKKFNIDKPFILYAGRKDEGKNIYTLLNYFREYKKSFIESDLCLLMIGGGSVKIPEDIQNEVIDLGFIDQQDKFDAYGAAVVLCQPSKNESFSIVIMESWLSRRPVLVHGRCSVTRDFVSQSNGGLYFETYYEFEECINYFISHPEISSQMGELGREFVLKNFEWSVIVRKYSEFFNYVMGKQG